MELYPMKLVPVPREIIWGGSRLKKQYGKLAPFERLAESWELSVRSDAVSVIENGRYGGMTLSDLISIHPEAVGTLHIGETFPMLVKFIDAEDDLSIQIHPDSVCAEKHGGESKTEMWYIVEADEEASIIYGLKDGMTKSDFESAVKAGDPLNVLRKINVKKGDVFFIPAGQPHAICKGVLIAEFQENSDTTYRLYDYERLDKDGKKRELHIAEALDSVKYYTDAEIESMQFDGKDERRWEIPGASVLCSCIYFRVSLLKQSAEKITRFEADEKSFAVLLFTDAYDANVSCGTSSLDVQPGDCVFIPAGAGDVTVCGEASVLIAEL